MRLIIATAVFAALAGCGPTLTPEQYEAQQDAAWTKPDAKLGEVTADRHTCEYEAHKATAGTSLATMQGAMAAGYAQGQLYNECMRAKGWMPATKR
jgi:hypothetical protein